MVSSMFTITSGPHRKVALKQTNEWIIYHPQFSLTPFSPPWWQQQRPCFSPPPLYLSYNVLIVETDWLSGWLARSPGIWGPWQASHSCLVSRSNCSERGAGVKALEHQAFGKEKLWRHDWVSNQREAEKGWGKYSGGWMKELSFKYALNDI